MATTGNVTQKIDTEQELAKAQAQLALLKDLKQKLLLKEEAIDKLAKQIAEASNVAEKTAEQEQALKSMQDEQVKLEKESAELGEKFKACLSAQEVNSQLLSKDQPQGLSNRWYLGPIAGAIAAFALAEQSPGDCLLGGGVVGGALIGLGWLSDKAISALSARASRAAATATELTTTAAVTEPTDSTAAPTAETAPTGGVSADATAPGLEPVPGERAPTSKPATAFFSTKAKVAMGLAGLAVAGVIAVPRVVQAAEELVNRNFGSRCE